VDVERPAVASTIPKWILVADDDDAIRALWTAVLTRAGYRVLAARNGLEALDLMRAAVPDLIILDLRMPGMSGGAFLQAFDGAPVFERIPVLIISGFLEEDTPQPSLWLRIVGRLAKPILPADLLAAVRAALADSGLPRVGKYPPGVQPAANTTFRG
jgi:CheY-like chemotaxis protein